MTRDGTRLIEKLRNENLVFDGAMGTEISKRIEQDPAKYFLLSVNHREIIEEIHREYISAGADVIMTNTLTLNSITSSGSGYTLSEILNASIDASLSAAGEEDVYVLQTIGPAEYLFDKADESGIKDVFKEQVTIGKDRVDGFIIETMYSYREVIIALKGAKEITHKPVLVTMTLNEKGESFDGVGMKDICEGLRENGADAVGINCVEIGEGLLELASVMLRKSELPVLIQPNLGIPKNIDGSKVYPNGEKDFEDFTGKLIKTGVKHIGGCCGTTPESIKSIRQEVDSSIS